jgi:hypothetical protein
MKQTVAYLILADVSASMVAVSESSRNEGTLRNETIIVHVSHHCCFNYHLPPHPLVSNNCVVYTEWPTSSFTEIHIFKILIIIKTTCNKKNKAKLLKLRYQFRKKKGT